MTRQRGQSFKFIRLAKSFTRIRKEILIIFILILSLFIQDISATTLVSTVVDVTPKTVNSQSTLELSSSLDNDVPASGKLVVTIPSQMSVVGATPLN